MIYHEHGYWIGQANGEHFFDPPLADALAKMLCGQSVLDAGCGLGEYVRVFRRAGIEAAGVDGNPATPYLTRWQCGVADLIEPWEVAWPGWETVMCLEVLEHIPAKYEETALKNLIGCCLRRLILSWAPPEQAGTGHVNGRPPEYVESRMAGFGLAIDRAASAELRGKATLSWFQNNLTVFDRC